MRGVGVQNVTSSDAEREELMAEEQNFRARKTQEKRPSQGASRSSIMGREFSKWVVLSLFLLLQLEELPFLVVDVLHSQALGSWHKGFCDLNILEKAMPLPYPHVLR